MNPSRQLIISEPSLKIPEGLTKREKDILPLLAAGLRNREIAQCLDLSEKTVRNRISEILGKIGVRNRTQAAVWACEHGFTCAWLLLASAHQNRDICP